jgi:asparagine N-glycosylation enzyme membrane subunit Stt3
MNYLPFLLFLFGLINIIVAVKKDDKPYMLLLGISSLILSAILAMAEMNN